MIIIKFKGIILNILAIIILSSCCNDKPKISYNYGFESRLVSSLIPMNCKENNIAIYNEFGAFRLGEVSYDLNDFDEKVGDSSFVFSIRINHNYLEMISYLENPRISICEKGILYIGRGIDRKLPDFPPECHFYFDYGTSGELNVGNEGLLYCRSLRYINQKKLDKLMTGNR